MLKKAETVVPVIQSIEEQAGVRPEKIAVYFKDRVITYSKLLERANQIANALEKSGIVMGDLVGIYMNRTPDIVAAVIAVQKAGAAYVPLDPGYPKSRLEYIAGDSRMKAILTETGLTGRLRSFSIDCTEIDVFSDQVRKESKEYADAVIQADTRAYVIYTSGSTGNPKGVQITHGSLSNFIGSMTREPGITDRDVVLFHTTICFDISILEMFLPLANGASIAMDALESGADGEILARSFEEYGVTIAQGTASMWSLLLDAGFTGGNDLKILCGGEAWSEGLAARLSGCCGSLWNMYGPTETTVWSMVNRIEKNAPVTLGKPVDNTQIYILDEYMNEVERGAVGELYIGGAGISAGYAGRPDLTAERFIPNPFGKGLSEYIYKTGDLVKKRENGDVEYIGRADFQIKLRGYRIELEEIEHVLESHRYVKQAAVVVWGEEENDKKLVAYYTAAGDYLKPTPAELRRQLEEALPEYMVPSFFCELEEFPLTLVNKIDRRALMEQNPADFDHSAGYTAPATDTELELEAIWEQILGIDKIGIHDNFLDIGGHSLLANRMVILINKKYDIKLTLLEFLTDGMTIFELAKIVEEKLIESLGEDEIAAMLQQLNSMPGEEADALPDIQ